MRFFTLFLVVFFLNSCGNEKLEKNYELDYDPNNEINLVTQTENGYQKVEIPGHILFYGHNKDFIITNQKPSDSIYKSEEDLVFKAMESKIFNTKFSSRSHNVRMIIFITAFFIGSMNCYVNRNAIFFR